jgi:rod shape-determining protein MreC
MQVGVHSARVLLISDINSRLPVLVGESGTRAIMAGDNGARPRLLYLSAKTAVAPGDKVVTSGDADAFPVGLPVGRVARMSEGTVEVEPYMSSDKLQYVRIFDFGLANTVANTTSTLPAAARVAPAVVAPAVVAPAPAATPAAAPPVAAAATAKPR